MKDFWKAEIEAAGEKGKSVFVFYRPKKSEGKPQTGTSDLRLTLHIIRFPSNAAARYIKIRFVFIHKDWIKHQIDESISFADSTSTTSPRKCPLVTNRSIQDGREEESFQA